MVAYYNEWDPFMAQWLRNLIEAGHLPPGDVDKRDIREVTPDDLKGYTQHHFFAGVGGWSEALALTGWPADRPVWTGSCPCPPFSSAGKQFTCPECNGKNPIPCPRRTGYFICCLCGHSWLADERHLWPELWRLIRDLRPGVVFGEQVAGKGGRIWLSGIRASLEILGYAVGGADLCAAGVGSPQIRQRLWWVADNGSPRLEERQIESAREKRQAIKRDSDAGRLSNASISRNRARDGQSGAGTRPQFPAGGHDLPGGLSDAGGNRREQGTGSICEGQSKPPGADEIGGVRNTSSEGRGSTREPGKEISQPETIKRPTGSDIAGGLPNPKPVRRRGRGDGDSQGEGGPLQIEGSSDAGFWSDFDILPFQDGKARRVEPGTFPLAHGVPNRVGRLCGYGNAINPQTAAVFIRACQEIIE